MSSKPTQIYLCGYGQFVGGRPGTREPSQIIAKAKELNAALVDIRFMPFSRYAPQWSERVLGETCALSDLPYYWLKDLGNTTRGQGEINISDMENGLRHLTAIIQRHGTVLLLCACMNHAKCHRDVVKKELVFRSYRCQEVVWPELDACEHELLQRIHPLPLIQWRKGSWIAKLAEQEQFALSRPWKMTEHSQAVLTAKQQALDEAHRAIRIILREWGTITFGMLSDLLYSEYQIEWDVGQSALDVLVAQSIVKESEEAWQGTMVLWVALGWQRTGSMNEGGKVAKRPKPGSDNVGKPAAKSGRGDGVIQPNGFQFNADEVELARQW